MHALLDLCPAKSSPPLGADGLPPVPPHQKQAGANLYAYPASFTASAAALPRIRSLALSAIISVEALRLAEIMRGMIEASMTRRPCSPWTRSWSSTTAHDDSAGPIRQVQPGW